MKKICYTCNKKHFKNGYKVVNTITKETVAYFCSEKCLRKKIPFAKIEDLFPQIKEGKRNHDGHSERMDEVLLEVNDLEKQ